MSDHDVVVIGAGLAGLRAAWRLADAGREVTVLEAADEVGGRETSRVVDGFRIDRGFHVLNPAYPAVRRWIDLDALQMRYFQPGVLIGRPEGLVTVAHPLRRPGLIPTTVRSGLITPREVAALARWVAPALLSPSRVMRSPDRSLADAWDAARVRGPLRSEVLEPFLAGVLGEDEGRTSDAFVRLLVRSFVLGRPGVPAEGIGAVPRGLADRARRAGATIRTGTRVDRVERRGSGNTVHLEIGETLGAATVLVAAGPEVAPSLVGGEPVPTKALTTWWFAAPTAPDTAMIAVDGRRTGPIVNSAVLSAVAPEYAPPGERLVQATALPARSGTVTDDEARRSAARIWGVDPSEWRPIARDDLAHALPEQLPPLDARRSLRLGEGLYWCGDHRDTASIQGALVSGDRAAGRILAD